MGQQVLGPCWHHSHGYQPGWSRRGVASLAVADFPVCELQHRASPTVSVGALLTSDPDSDLDAYETECGHWDTEDERYYFSETFEDWLASRRVPELPPFSDDGEVASWRLNLELSPLGVAFLTLDDNLLGDSLLPLA